MIGLDESEIQFLLYVCISNAIITLLVFLIVRISRSEQTQLVPRDGSWFEFSFILGPLISMPFALLPFLIDVLWGLNYMRDEEITPVFITIFCSVYALLGPLAGLLWRLIIHRYATGRLYSRLQMSLWVAAYAVIAGFAFLFVGELFFALSTILTGFMTPAKTAEAIVTTTFVVGYIIIVFAPFAGLTAGLATAFLGFRKS